MRFTKTREWHVASGRLDLYFVFSLVEGDQWCGQEGARRFQHAPRICLLCPGAQSLGRGMAFFHPSFPELDLNSRLSPGSWCSFLIILRFFS